MIKKLQALKNKKGFTLVELIIVLVILAILAALLLPTLTGYIDKANEMKVESACRMAVMATKAEVGEAYGKLPAGEVLPLAAAGASEELVGHAKGFTADAWLKLAEMDNATADSFGVAATVKTTGEIKALIYVTTVYACVYTPDGGFVVTKAADVTLPVGGITAAPAVDNGVSIKTAAS